MKILAPEVVGPLSQCSTKVQIRGNIAGATVIVVVNGADAASHVSKFADAVYTIGAALQANDIVSARQTLSSDSSDNSLPITVQAAPAQLSALTLQSQLYACARRLWTTGGVPGAMVQGRIGTQVVGTSEVVSGIAAFTYDPVLAAAEVMTLKQTTCTGANNSQTSPKATAQPSPLPVPVIEGPLIECQTSLTVSNVVDGAFVEFYRNGVLEKTFTFAAAREWRGVKELKKGDVVEVRQGFKCKKESPGLESFSAKSAMTVESVSALNAPKFLGIPCPGTTYLTLSKLIPGVRVVIMLNGSELGQTDAANTTHTFTVPPLPAAGKLTAHMSLCNKNGPDAEISVSSGQTLPDGAKVSDLFNCAAYVFVKVGGSSGNYLVYISNKAGQQISAYHNLIGFEKLIAVSPSLVAGDEITVNIQGCGGTWQKFGPFAVSAGAAPPPTIAEPLEAGKKYVTIGSQHAGAMIDLFINNQWKGSTISLGNLGITAVAFSQALKTGDGVFATQTLCGKTTKPSKTIKVVKARPAKPVLLKPTSNESNVDVQPTFVWQDPGAGKENAAESYHVVAKLQNSSTTVLDTTSLTMSLPSPVVLDHDTQYTWKVESLNSTGSSGFASALEFGTESEPPPQEADLHFDSDIESSSPGFPSNTPIELHILVVNSGNIASGDFSVEFDLKYHNGGALIDAVIADFPSLDGGQSTTIISIPVTLPGEDVRIDAYLTQGNTQIDYAFRIV